MVIQRNIHPGLGWWGWWLTLNSRRRCKKKKKMVGDDLKRIGEEPLVDS